MHKVMKTILCTLLIIITYVSCSKSKKNPECPKIDAPSPCRDVCKIDTDCTAPYICCPGNCIKGDSQDRDKYKTYMACLFPDKCRTGVCKNGASCEIDFTNKTNNGYKCTCLAGYSGKNCNQDIDECLSTPCQNGGECKDLVNDYLCCCPTGFTGKNCEQQIASCLIMNAPQPDISPCYKDKCSKYKDDDDVICIPKAAYFFNTGQQLEDITTACEQP